MGSTPADPQTGRKPHADPGRKRSSLPRGRRGAHGPLMRRHWLPACMSEEVAEPDGAPVRTRLLGEDLVVFRDTTGRLGVLGEHCPHRRASLLRPQRGMRAALPLSRLEIRCRRQLSGHGLRARGGACKPSRQAEILSGRARAAGSSGSIWARRDHARIRAAGLGADAGHPHLHRQDGDRLQLGADPGRLDRFGAQLEPAFHRHAADASTAPRPRNELAAPVDRQGAAARVQLTPFGFRYAAIRKPILNADTHDYVRITSFVAPFTVLIPPNDHYNLAQMLFPIDDVNTMFYWIAWHDRRASTRNRGANSARAQVGIDLDAHYPQVPHAREPFSAGPPGHEARRFHGHLRHPRPGYGDVGVDGPDRRPQPTRCWARAISPIVQFRRLMVAAANALPRRTGHRHDRAARPASQARPSRASCPRHRLAHARRRRGRARGDPEGRGQARGLTSASSRRSLSIRLALRARPRDAKD